jgi:hypothetical protein
MESQTLEIAFGQGALDFLLKQLGSRPPGDAVFTFPDYTLRFYLDPNIPGTDGRLDHAGTRHETRRLMAHTFPGGVLPDDLTRIINLSYEEVLRCYERGCFLAAVTMCGRTMETTLGGLYQKKKGVHPSEEIGEYKPGIGGILKYLASVSYKFPPGTKEKFDAIALHRNMAVHGNLTIPTVDETRSAIYLTKDVLRIAANDAPLVSARPTESE